ncbi:hypothetical protein HG535_0E02460 [Zygotorulaspora mrakii]|uniref:Uncharacterized protein n=1 Tax=Zygotorulaspora mrakii TaxID=42260 RepID=A0A7H9B5W1_ZYGMR|nr:uncharacterized protein HG535_0E02460 [Zygotorulaspora mrakii]QLG73162.1 hypothetical protein HG535_0E02460 [Zygotorulaspora mrakii]
MSEPETPLHAEANQELDINTVNELEIRDIEGLDLNPDLDDTETGESTKFDLNTAIEPQKRNRADEEEGENMFDDYDDFKPQINISSPFASNTKLNNLQNHHQIDNDGPLEKNRRLSLSQQSKFIAYCDEKLLNIQRKFVQSRGLNPQNGYSGLLLLLVDFKSLIDFIWYSIEGRPNTDYLLTEDPLETSQEQYFGRESTYFGQSAYLIRIADDLLDYTEKFEMKSITLDKQIATLSKLFKLLFILDSIFSRLIDGAVPGRVKMSVTDSVRLTSIAERTRLKLPWFFENQDIHGYHYEVSKIYEETLERCAK